MIKRKGLQALTNWKRDTKRKPMVLRGARQVGKTTLVNEFAKQFKHYIYLNLEKEEDKRLFEHAGSVIELIDQLFIRFNILSNEPEVLIFIDEIQECEKAIQWLRYFYEEKPLLYIIAAGSLLEFALRDITSFPVGRVQQYILHPIDFEEFLEASNNQAAWQALQQIPINDAAVQPLLNLFHQYIRVGGMPEVVAQYIETKDFVSLKQTYENLWLGYKSDVEKYGRNTSNKSVIRHVIDSAPMEKDRITFQHFGASNYKSREVGEALHALDMSYLIRLVYPTTNLAAPILWDLKRKPRLQFLDVGLLNYALQLHVEMISVNDYSDFYRGKIIQQIVTQEYMAQQHSLLYKPSFWVQENASNQAKIDFLTTYGSKLIPIEIKSGSQGKLKSLHQFVNKSQHPYAIRLLANKMSIEEVKTPEGKPYKLMNMPYFLACKLDAYIDWWMHEEANKN